MVCAKPFITAVLLGVSCTKLHADKADRRLRPTLYGDQRQERPGNQSSSSCLRTSLEVRGPRLSFSFGRRRGWRLHDDLLRTFSRWRRFLAFQWPCMGSVLSFLQKLAAEAVVEQVIDVLLCVPLACTLPQDRVEQRNVHIQIVFEEIADIPVLLATERIAEQIVDIHVLPCVGDRIAEQTVDISVPPGRSERIVEQIADVPVPQSGLPLSSTISGPDAGAAVEFDSTVTRTGTLS